MAEIVSITENVPGFACNNQCLKTRNFRAIEPGVNEFKFYAPPKADHNQRTQGCTLRSAKWRTLGWPKTM
jgi:hypothetical protein